ncbi:MAG: RNA methyltransferase [Planctomycetota bacterium]|nr:RNA methyltransferase [Planctomycetota bacterium]
MHFDDDVAYFATCAKGLESVLAAELSAPRIGAKDVRAGASGVYFAGTRATGYLANLWLRTGIRVLAEHGRAVVDGPDDLYDWACSLPWTKLMRLEQTFSVEARVRDSAITHSKYAAMRIKDALCDTFRDATGARPNVNVEAADLPLFLYVYRDEAILYRDLSGVTLHKRGYRDAMHKSSLNECVAASLVLLSKWDGSKPFCDPMCGSGTIALEAAMIGLNRAPGLLRKRFPFEGWPDFDRAAWKDCKSRAHGEARFDLAAPVCVNDHHAGALALAKKDAEAAGLTGFLRFDQKDIADYVPPEKPAVVCVNPPWGERLKDPELDATWRKLGTFLRERCAGAEAFVFTGNADVPRHLELKAAQRRPVKYGKMDCLALRYAVPEAGA